MAANTEVFTSTHPLVNAADVGDLAEVKRFLAVGVDPDSRDENTWTALHRASKSGHSEIVSVLLQSGSNVNAVTSLGTTAFHLAAHGGQLSVLRCLQQARANPHVVTLDGLTALMTAAHGTDSLKVVRYLIDELHLDIHATNNRRFCALHCAAQEGHVRVVEELLHRGADVHAGNEQGTTAFHLAARYGHLSLLRCLLQAGTNPHAVYLDSYTALMGAALGTGSLEVVRYLVDELQLDIHATNKRGFTALHCAAQEGHVRVVEELLHRGADVHAGNEQGTTAFHLAAQRGHLSVLKCLQQARANPYVVTVGGNTALMYVAMGTGSLEVVRYLLDELHLDIQATSNRGSTALHAAAYKGNVTVVVELLHRGANVNGVNDDGKTAEMIAVIYGHTEIADYLRLQLTHAEQQSPIPSFVEEYNTNTKSSDKLKKNQVHLATAKASTSTSSGVVPNFEQTHDIRYQNYYPSITPAQTSDGVIKARTNQQHRYYGLNQAKNQTQNTTNTTKSHVNKFMAQGITPSTVVREESVAVESDSSIQPSTSAVDIHQKQSEEMDDTYPNVPTPAFLPMSPGSWDEIMVQSPAMLDIINDVLETEEFMITTSTKSNEKDTPFTIQVQAPSLIQSQNQKSSLYKASTSKPGSSLFEPSISPIPQEIQIQQSVIPLSGKNVRRTMDQNIGPPIYDTEKHKDNDVNTWIMQLKEQAAKLKEKDEIIDRQAGKLKGKGKTIAGKGQKLASKTDKIKELEEDREHSREELNKKEMKLKGKGKQILEYQNIETDMKDIIDLKEKRLIAKDKRIAEMKKYHEEEAKKRKVGRTSNYYPDSPAIAALGILPERSPMTHSYLSAILKKQSEGEGSTQGLFSRDLDHKCTRADIEMIYSAMEYICILDCQSQTGGFTGTGFLLGIVNHPQSGQTFAAILTNNHIYQNFVNGTAYFNYYDTNAGRTNGIPLTKNNVLYDDTLDYAMFCVDNVTLIQRFSTKAKLIDKVTPLFQQDKSVTLIGHPNGEPLQVDMFMEIQFQNNILNDPRILTAITALRQNRIIGSNVHFFEKDCRLFYHCNSFHGASGSPCFRIGNGHFDLVSLHSGGIFLNNINPGTNDVSDYESGVLMHLIKNNINLKMVAAGMIWM